MSNNKVKKPFYKRWWFWLIIIIFIFSMGDSDDKADQNTPKEEKQEISSNVKENIDNSKSESKTESASSSSQSKDVGELVNLKPGNYIVGEDIKPGRYVITSVQGSGNLTSTKADINVILDNQYGDLGVPSYTVTLKQGDDIKLESIQLTKFEPVTDRKFQTSLTAGQWEVGEDIEPGIYNIKAVSGRGNVVSLGAGLNEILSANPEDEDFGTNEVNNVRLIGKKIELSTTAKEIQLIKK